MDGGLRRIRDKVAVLRVGQCSKENWGDSRRVTRISWMHEGDRKGHGFVRQ